MKSSQNYCCFYCTSLSTKSKSSPKTTWIAPVDVAIPQMCSLNGNTRGLHYIFCKTRCMQTLEKHCYHFRQLLIFLFTNESTTYAYIYIYWLQFSISLAFGRCFQTLTFGCWESQNLCSIWAAMREGLEVEIWEQPKQIWVTNLFRVWWFC